MIVIDYEKLFKIHFDPRNSLFDKIIENIPNSQNRIHFDAQLNKLAKEYVFNYLAKKDQSKTNVRSHLSTFEADTYNEYICCFQFKLNESQNDIQNKIINDTFNELKSKNILYDISSQNIDLIGIYLFISKTGLVVCFVNCARSSDTFSPEKFLEVLKLKGSVKSNVQIDNDENGIQKLADSYASEFAKYNRNSRKDFKSLFREKYSYNSAYYRFAVKSDKNNQIVGSILNNNSLKSFLNQDFDKVGIQLFNVGGQSQVLIIISNSNKSPPKDPSLLNEFEDDDSGSELFGVDSFITTYKRSKEKNKKGKSNKKDDYDSKQILNKCNNSNSDDEEEDFIFDDLPPFNSPSPVRIKFIKQNPSNPQISSPTSIIRNKLINSNNLDDSKNNEENEFSDLQPSISPKKSPLLNLYTNNSINKKDNHIVDDDDDDFSDLHPTISPKNSPILNLNNNKQKDDKNDNNVMDDGDDDFSDLHPTISPKNSPILNLNFNDKQKDDKNDNNVMDDGDDDFSDLHPTISPKNSPILNLNFNDKQKDDKNDNNVMDDGDDDFSDLHPTISPKNSPILNLNFNDKQKDDKNDNNVMDDGDDDFSDLHPTISPKNSSILNLNFNDKQKDDKNDNNVMDDGDDDFSDLRPTISPKNPPILNLNFNDKQKDDKIDNNIDDERKFSDLQPSTNPKSSPLFNLGHVESKNYQPQPNKYSIDNE